MIWALDRIGVNVSSLNPFHWQRRRQWQKQLQTKSIHLLNKPIEAASVLIISIVNAEGLVSKEQKNEIYRIFREELNQNTSGANDLFVSGTFMLKDIFNIVPEIPHILAPNKDSFTEVQSISLVQLLRDIASFEGDITSTQQSIIEAVEKELIINKVKPDSW